MTHDESADLNLLPLLGILLEERHISRAAARAHMSQSAMSRSLQRLRTTLHDDLLVRTGNGYELTPRARTILRELESMLPRLRALVRGGEFEPATADDTVRVNCTDYATTILGDQGLFQQIFRQAPHLSMVIEPLSRHTFDDLERGRIDLALSPVKAPTPMRWTKIFEEDFVCVVWRDHPVREEQFTLEHLAEYPHSSVVVLPAEEMLVEQQLQDLGVRPPSGLRAPYFTAAAIALRGTELIATMPRRLAHLYEADPTLRVARAPAEFQPFAYCMIWHPRLDTDPVHSWVRSRVLAAGAELMGAEPTA
ncbi:MAG TPA: LysR family transcriptional regulator [Streptosporangiaceae bacterium]|nr:LysR family transcriptional regulator [Streptosporangiaceae bacterium]